MRSGTERSDVACTALFGTFGLQVNGAPCSMDHAFGLLLLESIHLVGLLEERLQRSIYPEVSEPGFSGIRLDPIAFFSSRSCWAKVEIDASVDVGLKPFRSGGNAHDPCFIFENNPFLHVVHGYPGSTWDWSAVVPDVANKTKVVVIDMLGFSEIPGAPQGVLTDQELFRKSTWMRIRNDLRFPTRHPHFLYDRIGIRSRRSPASNSSR